MAHDPRVTQQLSRLGGIYRDPNRVDRDAATLCCSPVGNHLQPICAEFYDNNGEGSNVLVLQGTVALHFRGQTYQQLVDIYIPSQYPIAAPIPFVRLANEDMYLKENHKHVANDGRVYMPYLHEWNQATHNLIEMVVSMSSVFSADPPVYTRLPTQVRTTSTATTTHNNNNNNSTSNYDNHSYDTMQQMQQAAELIRLRQSQQAAEREREQIREDQLRLERQRMEQMLAREHENIRKVEEQERNDNLHLARLRGELCQKMYRYLTEKGDEMEQTIHNDQLAEKRLLLSQSSLDKQLPYIKQRKEEIEIALEDLAAKKEAITTWLQEAETATDEQEISVDDMIVSSSHLHQQMLDLSAENAAIEDALYFVDRALYQNNLTLETHLKEVRKLAKRQFLVRAHLIKINQVLIDRNNSMLTRW